MTMFPRLDDIRRRDLARVGGKAFNCARLRQAGFPVPDGLVIPIDVADRAVRGLAADSWFAAGTAGALFAVRSSGVGEDGEGHSFAGVHDTQLNVERGRLIEAVLACRRSAGSAQARAYREARDIGHDDVLIAVLVQQMVPAETSGVAFTINPVTGADELVVNAGRGLGEALVSGRIDPDEFRIRKEDATVLSARSGAGGQETGGASTLSASQLADLAGILTRIERHYGAPQDVEWCHDGRQFWIVQSRPVTTRIPDPEWTRANLAEVLPDQVSPQALAVYVDLLDRCEREFFGRMMAPESELGPIIKAFHGRLYFNLSQLRHVTETVGAAPADTLRSFGHAEAIRPEDEVARRPPLRQLLPALPDLLRLMFNMLRMGRVFRDHTASTDKILARLQVDPQTLSDQAIIATYDWWLAIAPETIKAVFVMSSVQIHEDVLRKACRTVGFSYDRLVYPQLAAGQRSVSTQQAVDLVALADVARHDARAVRYMLTASGGFPDYREALSGTMFLERFDRFLNQYGHRGRYESDWALPRLHEDPASALFAIQAHLEGPPDDTALTARRQEADAAASWREFEARLTTWQRWTLLPRVRSTVRKLKRQYLWREQVRSDLTRVVSRMRAYHLVLANRFVERGWIDRRDDYFLLEMNEVMRVVSDPLQGPGLRAIAAGRGAQLAAERELQMPLLMRASDLPALMAAAQTGASSGAAGDSLTGLCVSPGSVEAEVVVMRDPGEFATMKRGAILVAPATDPSWTPLFTLASGVIVEVGGMLSHASTIAREYGLPALANVKNATRILKTGDRIRLDASAGRARLLTLACVGILLWPAAARAQVASPPDPAARSECSESGRGSSPAPADSDEALKRLVDCGYELSGRNEYLAARRVFELAIEMARRRADRRSLAAALNGYGGVLFTLGEVDRAEPLLVESVRLSDEIGDKDGMAEASSYLGRLRTIQARYADARVYHLRSLELWSAIDDRRGMAVALNNIGNASRALGDYVTALDYFQRSLDALERLGDSRRSATVIDNMGLIARRLGDYGRGLELAQRALKIREGFEDRAGIAKSLDSLSEVYEAQGNYGAALAALARSLDLRRSLGLAHATAESLNNIAVIYQAQGSYEQAVKYLRLSLALNQAKVGSRSLAAEIRTHLGELFLLQGQLTRAARSLTRSLAISEAGRFKPQAADARYVLARVYIATRQFSAAQAALNACLAFRDEAGDRRGRADVLIEMAELDRRRGRFQQGLTRATEAGQLAAQMELPDLQWRALALIGRLQLERSRPIEARDAFDAAIALIEGMRSQNPGPDEARSRFFADRLAPYRERIALALAASDTAGAFSFAERSKARLLLDVIRGDGTASTRAMSGEERGEELARRASLSSANAELALAARTAPPDQVRLSELRDKRQARRLEYEEFQARLYAAHPELRAIRAAAPVIDVGAAQALLPGPTAAIVEFVAGRDRTYAFVVTVSGVHAITLNGTTAALGRQVRRFRNQLEQRDARATETARTLYDVVVGPMRAMLEGTTDLIVAPDGVLWDLPFQALQSRARRYLIEDMAVSYAPSITVLREMMRLRRAAREPRTLLAFANPAPDGDEALPDAEDEVRRVADTYGASSRVYVGAEAREDRWKAEAPAYRVVHIATHGVLDNSSPLYSHLLMARPGRDNIEDGLLEAWEIMNVPLNADLVVLSACETARGRIAPGEGILGLMWAVFVAGSPATLVSQWRVDSPSTTALMVAFHREWNATGAGLSKARALQAASIAVLHSRGRSRPFYWAGFILAGDGR